MTGTKPPLQCYVARVMRYVSRRGHHWLWFFTDPLVYSVWLRDFGDVTPEQFLLEQAESARAHYRSEA